MADRGGIVPIGAKQALGNFKNLISTGFQGGGFHSGASLLFKTNVR
jgi:hypothetical protein